MTILEETLQKLKAIAYWDRKELKQVLNEALVTYLAGKEMVPVPDRENSHF